MSVRTCDVHDTAITVKVGEASICVGLGARVDDADKDKQSQHPYGR